MGAVMTIASTAMTRIVPPQERPIDKAIPPIEACTVAFGKYAKTQNAFSRAFIPQPRTQGKTPTDLDSRPKSKTNKSNPPDSATYLKPTAAPTRTNRLISKNFHYKKG